MSEQRQGRPEDHEAYSAAMGLLRAQSVVVQGDHLGVLQHMLDMHNYSINSCNFFLVVPDRLLADSDAQGFSCMSDMCCKLRVITDRSIVIISWSQQHVS